MKYYKYQSINKNSIIGLQQSKLWASKAEEFNDPFEFRLNRRGEVNGIKEFRDQNPHIADLSDDELVPKFIDAMEDYIKQWGVICFSLCETNILMWSHYSDKHKGMCLEFSLDNEKTLKDVGLSEIQYTETYPDIDMSNIWHQNGAAKILFTKAKNWEYEQEIRSMHVPNEGVPGIGLRDYIEHTRLSGIIFGYRTSEDDISLIKNILIDQKVTFSKANLANDTYNLEIFSHV